LDQYAVFLLHNFIKPLWNVFDFIHINNKANMKRLRADAESTFNSEIAFIIVPTNTVASPD